MERFRRLFGLLILLLAFLAPEALPLQAAISQPQATSQDLPVAARRTLAYVRQQDAPPPGQVGGRRFGNYGRGGEQKLPVEDARGHRIEYREWDIHPRVPGRNRGAERLVTGSDGRAWYTANHYRSFVEVR